MMNSISRRRFLGLTSGTAAAWLLARSPFSMAFRSATFVDAVWSGALTSSSIQVNAKINHDSDTVRLLVSENVDLSNALSSDFFTAELATNNRMVGLPISGLSPGTHYYYGIESAGVVDDTVWGGFKTPANIAQSFTIAFGSCADTGSAHTVFESIRSLNPLFFLHTGDMHYEDIGLNDRDIYRAAYDAVLTSGTQSALYRQIPIVYIWDDHDYGRNNSDGGAPGREAARLTYQEYVPHYPLAAGEGDVPLYQSFTIGRVHFIVTDLRSERSPNGAPDDANKSMMGSAQKAWFKNQLLAANGNQEIIVWVGSVPWIGLASEGEDFWAGFATEREELANFIRDNSIEGLLLLSGDAHMIAIDDGSNSDYATGGGAGFPLMHAAALDRPGSVKGGPYSHGAFPGGGQFGLLSIQDDGGEVISITLSGRDSDNNVIVEYTFTKAAEPVSFVDSMWSGALTSNSAQVNAKIDHDSSTVRVLVSEQPDLSNAISSGFISADLATNNRMVGLPVSGLTAGTHYYYGIESASIVDNINRGEFETPMDGAQSFTIALGACAQTGSSHAVFDTIRSHSPLFFLHTGDMHYADIGSNDRDLFRAAYDAVLASATQSDLYRQVPLAYMWDDHDYGRNNSDGGSPSREAARLTYQEYVPHYPLAAGIGDVAIYQAFTIGRVRFILTDLRSERTSRDAPDDANKTMMGGVQKAWFKDQLLAANGNQAVIVWVGTVPWIGEATADEDFWAGYATEREELANFIRDNQIKGLMMLSGDAHMVAIDDGRNSGYSTGGGASFPLLHAAALDRPGSVKGGPYSHGAFPGGGQFGTVTFDDDGGDIIHITMRGHDFNNNVLVEYSFFVADTSSWDRLYLPAVGSAIT